MNVLQYILAEECTTDYSSVSWCHQFPSFSYGLIQGTVSSNTIWWKKKDHWMLALVLDSFRDFCFYQRCLFLEPAAQNEIVCPLYQGLSFLCTTMNPLGGAEIMSNKFLLPNTLLLQALHINFLFLGYSFFSRFHTVPISVSTPLVELFMLHYLSAGNSK